MLKKSIYCGLWAGGILTAGFIVQYFLFMKDFKAENWTLGEITGYSAIVLSLTAIFFGVRSYRDKVLGGKISFGKAFTLGMGISAVASVIIGIYIYLLYTVISPDLGGRMIEIYREKIKTSGGTEEVITRQLAEFEAQSEMAKNPVLNAGLMLVTVLLIGIVISLIAAAILRRKEPELINTV